MIQHVYFPTRIIVKTIYSITLSDYNLIAK